MPTYRVPVELMWAGSGSPGANVWHVRTTAEFGADPLQLQAAIDAIRTFYRDIAVGDADTVYPLIASGTLINLGTVVDVDSQEIAEPTFDEIVASSNTGLAPAPVAVTVTWRTSIAARRGRGRTFVGPVGSLAVQTDGTIKDEYVDNLRTVANNLVAASVPANNWAVGVYGQVDSLTGEGITPEQRRLAPKVLRDITGATVRDKWAVLRSRRD